MIPREIEQLLDWATRAIIDRLEFKHFGIEERPDVCGVMTFRLVLELPFTTFTTREWFHLKEEAARAFERDFHHLRATPDYTASALIERGQKRHLAKLLQDIDQWLQAYPDKVEAVLGWLDKNRHDFLPSKFIG